MSNKRKRRTEQLHRQVVGVLIYTVILVAVLGIAGVLLIRALRPPDLAPLAGNVIDVAANMGGFDKPEIRIKAGEPVTIRLTSLDNQYHTDGGGQHQWAVDELGANVIAQPLSSNIVTFTPEKPGEYTFYCDICCGGRANPTMNGKLIVEA
ncbi:MAG TPA: cupredoxin domain-containing protein [Caldilineaceae bacterium]|nr:cupredoxin domain-containing protein [Caldilineaceae bacterium]